QCLTLAKHPAGAGPPWTDPGGEPPGTVGPAPTAAAPDSTRGSSGVTLQLTGFGGKLAVAFSPVLVVQETPTIEGAIILPAIFDCPDTTRKQVPLQSKLRFGP